MCIVYGSLDEDIPNDTKAGLLYLKSTFCLERFTGRIPAIILKHQLYSVIKDKTVVDRQLVGKTENQYSVFIDHLICHYKYITKILI